MIILGDCLDEMKKMADNSIDAICTDPPYGLTSSKNSKAGFMGKKWDANVPGIEYWAEMLRICKPGAMLAAFGAPRTHHHLMNALEESDWIIRDVIMWINGQSFPKSHQFSKQLGEEWKGYGTALKSSYEPIILAMKSLEGTFAQNAEKWGVAGLNIDGSRIFRNDESGWSKSGSKESENKSMSGKNYARYPKPDNPLGRWPSNLILNEEAAAELDEQSGVSKSTENQRNNKARQGNSMGKEYDRIGFGHNDSGGASRFFYVAKASPSERDGSIHPTMKPLKLMKYLLKLIMPPSKEAIVLDPFMGSGTTCLSAKELGIKFIGIEKEPEYFEILKKAFGKR